MHFLEVKKLSILILVFFSLNSFSKDTFNDYLKHTNWKVNCSPFEDPNREEIILSKVNSDNFYDHYGYSLGFDSLQFSSSYSAPCGNDCFTSVIGMYFFVGENRIKIFVSKISRNGFCSQKSEEVNKTIGLYDITATGTGFILKKVI